MRTTGLDVILAMTLAFLGATVGLTNWQIAGCMNLVTPGINWHGSPKGRILEAFIDGNAYGYSIDRNSFLVWCKKHVRSAP